MGLPLIKHGISVLALESPFYGTRKPADQKGSKLRSVKYELPTLPTRSPSSPPPSFAESPLPPLAACPMLRVVSDLLTLGWATIFESICLLHMLDSKEGYERKCERMTSFPFPIPHLPIVSYFNFRVWQVSLDSRWAACTLA